MQNEVALFIDLENIRYGMLNGYGQEPDFGKFVEKAKTYGRPTLMKAYADFSEHPADLNRHLQVVGIDAINVPVKRIPVNDSGNIVERIKNAADMALALDAIMEAIECDQGGKKKTFLLVTGDRDYVKLVALLKNRFGQRVIVTGVYGSIAVDLVRAAGEVDYIEVEKINSADNITIKKALVRMVSKGPRPLDYWSLKIIDQWAQDARQEIPGTAKEKRDAISELVAEGVLKKKERPDSKMEAYLDFTEAKNRSYL